MHRGRTAQRTSSTPAAGSVQRTPAASSVQRRAAAPESGNQNLQVMQSGQLNAMPMQEPDFATQEAAYAPGGELDKARTPKGNSPSQAEVGAKINDAMDEMNQGQHGIGYRRNGDSPYGSGASFYFEQPTKESNFKWTLKKGVSASEGLGAWLAGPTVCECKTAIVAAQYKAILDVVGAKRFDAMFGSSEGSASEHGSLVIYASIADTPLRFVTKQTVAGESKKVGEAGKRPGVEVGDKYYFANHPGYPYKHPEGLWNGENAIYAGTDPSTGDQLWTGLGASKKTEATMLAELRDGYNDKRTGADYAGIVVKLGLGGSGDSRDKYYAAIPSLVASGEPGKLAYVFEGEQLDSWQKAADRAKAAGQPEPRKPSLSKQSPHPWRLADDKALLDGGGGFSAEDSWKIDASKLRR